MRVLVFEKDRIVGRIQGRWDIGYELLRDSPQSSEEFLIVNRLKASKRYVLPEDLQGPTESLVWECVETLLSSLWKVLRQEMIGGSNIEKAQSVLDMLGASRLVEMRSRD